MKANQKIALLTGLLLAVTAFTACGAQQPETAPESTPAATIDTTKFDGVIAGSFATIAGQSLPEAPLPEKPEGATRLPGDDGYLELQHKIHEANWKDAMFSKHSSLTITMDRTYQHINDLADYVYLAPDHSYMHASQYEQYSKDREVYQWVGIDTANPYPIYVADLTENYNGHVYWYVPEQEADFFDTEHETFTDIYEKDGVLWQYSVMDETGSKNYLADKVGDEYGGEIIHCFVRLDAKTYEILEAREYAEKDGKTYLLGIDKIDYDQPEPERISSFLKNFNNGMVTANVTFVANPGKANEISKTMAVPQNSLFSWFSQDIPEGDLYFDAACTQPVDQEWDGRSDITYYIVPHAE
ncbi:MAG: hypothetical protein J5851_01170 [Oscillospiraceae bacterium]|nr:hypothetical protein [Oscillospiraceae bacterium]